MLWIIAGRNRETTVIILARGLLLLAKMEYHFEFPLPSETTKKWNTVYKTMVFKYWTSVSTR